MIFIPIPSTGFDFPLTFRQFHHFRRGKAVDLKPDNKKPLR